MRMHSRAIRAFAVVLLSLLTAQGATVSAQVPLPSISPPPPPPPDPCGGPNPAAFGPSTSVGQCPIVASAASALDPATSAVPAASPMAFYAVGSGVGDNSSSLYRFSYWGGITDFVHIGETGVVLWDIAVDNSSGTALYAIGQNGRFYSVHPETGALTHLSTPGNSINSLEFCFGTLYGWGTSALITINPSTGQTTSVVQLNNESAGDLMCSGIGLYGIARGTGGRGDNLIVINPTYGLTAWTGIDFPGTGFYGGEFDGQGQLFVSRQVNGTLQLYHVDMSSHAITLVGTRSSSLGMNGLTTLPVAW